MHKPERQPNESVEDYKLRRKLSKRLVDVAKTGQMTKFQQQLIEKFKRGEVK